MSARNRGTESDLLGRYDTPAWAVHRLLDRVEFPGGDSSWLEPCAGDGAIIRAIDGYTKSDFTGLDWTLIDVEPRGLWAGDLIDSANFLEWEPPWVNRCRGCQTCGFRGDHFLTPGKFKVGITNPPFHLTLQIVLHMLDMCDSVTILQRLNWLEGAPEREPLRYEFLQEFPPDVYTLPNRPVFTRNGLPLVDSEGNVKKGTDATAYGWFVWGEAWQGGIHRLLANTPIAERTTRKPKTKRKRKTSA